MADLLSAMVKASKKVADPLAAAYASGNRPFTVRITRPTTVGSYDRKTNKFINDPDELIYQGPARIYAATGGLELEIGDERTTFTSARASIDGGGQPPRVDDLFAIVDTDQAQATHLVGRVFTVSDVEVGGHFGIGYRLSLSGAAPSRRT